MPETLIPIAISSQIADSGEERIHVANYNLTSTRTAFVPTLTLIPGVPSGQLMRTVLGLAWSANGQYLFTGGEAQTNPYFPRLCVWERAAGTSDFTLLPSITPDADFLPVAMDLSSDGGYLAVAENAYGQFEIFSVLDGTLTKIQTLSNGGANIGGNDTISFSPNADYLAVISSQGSYGTGIYKRTGDVFDLLTTISGGGFSCKFSPDGNYLLTTITAGHRIFHRVGDTFTDVTPVGFALASSAPLRVAFSNDGAWMVALKQSPSTSLYIYSVNNGTFTLQQSFNTHSVYPTDIAISGDGMYLALVTANTNKPEITMYARAGGTFYRYLDSTEYSNHGHVAKFCPQNNLIALGGSWSSTDSLHIYRFT